MPHTRVMLVTHFKEIQGECVKRMDNGPDHNQDALVSYQLYIQVKNNYL